MATTAKPAPAPNTNRIGLTLADYKGLPSTLCAGCGHDSISSKIIKAFYEANVDPYRVAKLSGIGCSSKSPAYFLSKSCGFNSVHGRMPSIATGAMLANKDLIAIGVSGDGDTGNIGLGQFMHCVRRNIPMIYIIENNGVYGLTKGQFSATADAGSKLKTGEVNHMQTLDLCALAVGLGCGFVARSFAGDPKQLVPIIKAALAHKGTAVIDVISPCVTFNDHEGSTKSYKYGKEHDVILQELDFVPSYQSLEDVDYEPGTTKEVKLPDGSHILLKKLGRDYDPTNKMQAIAVLQSGIEKCEMITGLLYIEPTKPDYTKELNLYDKPLAHLSEEKIRPPKQVLDEIMQSLR